MYFSDIITLRTVTRTTDSNAMPVEAYVDVVVWADRVEPSQSEFYSAGQQKTVVTSVFMVHSDDYTGQTEILYNGSGYHVERTFVPKTNKSLYGLVCSDKVV